MPAPKATALKKLQGTHRPCRDKGDSVERFTEAPKPPAYLSPEGRDEWLLVAPQAVAVGLAAVDVRSLVLLCEALAVERQLRETIAREGASVLTADGGLKAHPLLAAANQARIAARALLGDHGLNPKGRVTLPPPPKADPYRNAFEDF